jgi:glycosyltransferase involved in cell wall biosynthesis
MLDPWFQKSNPIKFFLRTVFWKLVEHRVVRDSGGLFFSCAEEKRLAKSHFLRKWGDDSRPDDACHVVGYGALKPTPASNSRNSFYETFPISRERRLLLFLGRIHPKKGIDILIAAFSNISDRFPEWDIVIAGPDNSGLRTSLESQIAGLRLEGRIHWTGMIFGETKTDAIRAAEIFVLPSHQENFGIAVVEAMALGRPILLTDKVNIWQEVESSGAGEVVSDDAEAIARGLAQMCKLTKSELSQVGEKARKCFSDNFDLERNAVNMLETMARFSN